MKTFKIIFRRQQEIVASTKEIEFNIIVKSIKLKEDMIIIECKKKFKIIQNPDNKNQIIIATRYFLA